jgi:hypothetical protein
MCLKIACLELLCRVNIEAVLQIRIRDPVPFDPKDPGPGINFTGSGSWILLHKKVVGAGRPTDQWQWLENPGLD